MERHHQHCFDHHHRRALGPWFHHRVTLPPQTHEPPRVVRGCFFYPRITRRTRKKILVKDYSKDFYLDFEPVRRSIINSSPKARYSSAFSVEIFVKDFVCCLPELQIISCRRQHLKQDFPKRFLAFRLPKKKSTDHTEGTEISLKAIVQIEKRRYSHTASFIIK